MKTSLPLLHACTALLLVGLGGRARGDELPEDAKPIVAEYQRAANAIHERAEGEIAVLRAKTLPALRVLQDKYCRAAKLDEAVAIRDLIRQLSGVLPDPGVVRASPEDIGKSFLFEVTGSLEGGVWGSEVYTTDSSLAAATVHAGVLKPGEKAVVRVRIIAGQKSYLASTHNGVTSQGWGPWNTSFTVERAKGAAALPAERANP